MLRQRQQVQQSKSVHELSKIGNVNQIPLPFKMPLPDIPLPKPTKIFKVLSNRRSKKKDDESQEATNADEIKLVEPYESVATPTISPDGTEEELLRCEDTNETSSIDADRDLGHREQVMALPTRSVMTKPQ